MTRRAAMPESAVLKAVKDYLSLRGILVFRANSGVLRNATGRPVRFGVVGHPDLYGVLPGGRAFFLEIKAGRNQPTKHQAAVLAALGRAGAAVGVVRSVAEAAAWLAGLGI